MKLHKNCVRFHGFRNRLKASLQSGFTPHFSHYVRKMREKRKKSIRGGDTLIVSKHCHRQYFITLTAVGIADTARRTETIHRIVSPSDFSFHSYLQQLFREKLSLRHLPHKQFTGLFVCLHDLPSNSSPDCSRVPLQHNYRDAVIH